MTHLLQAFAAFSILCGAVLVIVCKLAPWGHEDANGFYYDDPPEGE